MLTLSETKLYLRIDGDDEDTLVSSLIEMAKELVEDILRKKLTEFEEVPETVRHAVLLTVATLYEQRQVTSGSDGINMQELLSILRRMLFAYRDNSRW